MELYKFLQSLSRNKESCSPSYINTMREILFSKWVVKGCQNVAKECAGPISQKPLLSISRVDSNNINIIKILFSSQFSMSKCLSEVVSCIKYPVIGIIFDSSFLYRLSILSFFICNNYLPQSSSITKLFLNLKQNISNSSNVLMGSLDQLFDTFLSVNTGKSRFLASRYKLIVDGRFILTNFRQISSKFKKRKFRKSDSRWLQMALSIFKLKFFAFLNNLLFC